MAEQFIEGFKKEVIELPLVNLLYVDKDGVCITREYDFFITIKFEAINLALLSDEEKKDFAEKFMEILNTVHSYKKIILYSETKQLDVGLTIKEFDEAIRRCVLEKNQAYVSYLQQQQSLWAEYASTTRIISSYMSIFYNTSMFEKRNKLSLYETARSNLLITGQALITKFEAIGVLAKILNSKEILKEIWSFLHPRTSNLYENDEIDALSLSSFVINSTRRLYDI